MCGICGGLGKLDQNIIEGLLLANESRGDHSTGIACRSLTGELTIIKKAQPAHEFITKNDLSVIAASQCVIGHTRWATTGAITDANAHPLTAGKVTGVHNGVISNHASIPHGGQVDSQAIFYLLDKYIKEPWKAFSEIDGSCAAAWMVEGDDKLHFVKSVNPLHIAMVGDALYFSSEFHALFSVLRAAGIDKIETIAEVEEDHLLSVSPDKNFTFTMSPVHFKKVERYNNWHVVGSSKGKQRSKYIDDYELEEEARERAIMEAEIAEGLGGDPDAQDIREIYKSLPAQEAAYHLATEEGCVVCQGIMKEGDTVYYDDEDICIYCEEDARAAGMTSSLERIKI